MPDLYAYEPESVLFEFTGSFSLMSNIGGFAPEPLGFSRWNLGWLDDFDVACHEGAGVEYSIAPIEVDAIGTQLVLVPVGDGKLVAVESRRGVGFDSGLPEEGVLVYVVDTTIESGRGQVVVHPPGQFDRSDALLNLGEWIVVEGVEISFVDSAAGFDTVYVGYAGE